VLCRTLTYLFGLSLLIPVAGKTSSAQSISIFGNATPSNLSTYGTPITGGLKFWSTQSGAISGIRFYRAAVSPQGYAAMLYATDGTLLGSATIAQESGPLPGWQEADFASPISISPNKTYVVAYYVPSGSNYQLVPYGLTNGMTTGPLTAPASSAVGGNGVYSNVQAFPNTPSARNSNFLVDVLFTPAAPTPFLTLSFDPANPSIASNAPAGTVVTTITASWSDGTPFTGTLSFGPPNSNDQATFTVSGNQLIVNPDGPGLSGDGDTTQLVTIVATQ
jgi:hypothetical protein